MAFMRGEVTRGYAEINHIDGETSFIPWGYEELAVRHKDDEIIIHSGYIGRLQAPGYLDATEWTPCEGETDAEALASLANQADVCPHCWDACWDTTNQCKEHDKED